MYSIDSLGGFPIVYYIKLHRCEGTGEVSERDSEAVAEKGKEGESKARQGGKGWEECVSERTHMAYFTLGTVDAGNNSVAIFDQMMMLKVVLLSEDSDLWSAFPESICPSAVHIHPFVHRCIDTIETNTKEMQKCFKIKANTKGMLKCFSKNLVCLFH